MAKFKNSEECFECKETFSFLLLRHHCRLCGESFCGEHSDFFDIIPSISKDTRQRTCRRCHYIVQQQAEEQADEMGGLKLKGSYGFPIVGETPQLLQDPVRFCVDREKQFGSSFKTKVFGEKTCVVTDHKTVCEVLNNDAQFKNGCSHLQSLKDLYGKGLPLLDGDEHASTKGLFYAAVTTKACTSYLPIIRHHSDRLISLWMRKSSSSTPSVCVYEDVKDITHDLYLHLTLGITDATDAARIRAITQNLWRASTSTTSSSVGLANSTSSIRKELIDLIVERLIVIDRDKHREEEDAGRTFVTIAARMLQANHDYPLPHIAEQLVWFVSQILPKMIGSWFSSVVFELGRNASVTSRLKQTIQLAGSSVDNFDADADKQLQHVIVETGRLWPPLVMVTRGLDHSDGVRVGVNKLPANWKLLFSLHLANRDPRAFTDASVFNPSRWATTTPPTSLTMGVGSRACPAERLVYAQLKIILFVLLKHFDFELENGSSSSSSSSISSNSSSSHSSSSNSSNGTVEENRKYFPVSKQDDGVVVRLRRKTTDVARVTADVAAFSSVVFKDDYE